MSDEETLEFLKELKYIYKFVNVDPDKAKHKKRIKKIIEYLENRKEINDE